MSKRHVPCIRKGRAISPRRSSEALGGILIDAAGRNSTAEDYHVLQFSGGLIITTIVLMVLVTIPIKAGAHMADARETGMGRCAAAAIIGIVAGYISSQLLGEVIGSFIAAPIGFILAVRFVLGTTLVGALGVTVVAMLVSIIGFWCLSSIGIIGVDG